MLHDIPVLLVSTVIFYIFCFIIRRIFGEKLHPEKKVMYDSSGSDQHPELSKNSLLYIALFSNTIEEK
jgi:hypothetical protein